MLTSYISLSRYIFPAVRESTTSELQPHMAKEHFFFPEIQSLAVQVQLDQKAVAFFSSCEVPEIIHSYPMEGHWKLLGEGWSLKSKF